MGGKPRRLTFFGLCREGVSASSKGHSLVSIKGRNILGFGSIRKRSGPRAWEVSQLYLDLAEAQLEGMQLLEKLCQLAGENGAERVFLRINRDDPVLDVCKKAGFFPYYQEYLYVGRTRRKTTIDKLAALRTKVPADDHAIFRLYSASVPHKVRMALGLTLEEWIDSRERCSGKCREMVRERQGNIVASVRLTEDSHRRHLEIVSRPEESDAMEDLLDYDFDEYESGKKMEYAMVPDYQPPLRQLLNERGLENKSTHVVMVKFTTKRVGEEAVVATKAAPIGG